MRSDPQPRPDGLTPGDHTLEQESSGRLKIFFGYAAGVGKTYAMLDAALRAKEAGTDVVLGFLSPPPILIPWHWPEDWNGSRPSSLPVEGRANLTWTAPSAAVPS